MVAVGALKAMKLADGLSSQGREDRQTKSSLHQSRDDCQRGLQKDERHHAKADGHHPVEQKVKPSDRPRRTAAGNESQRDQTRKRGPDQQAELLRCIGVANDEELANLPGRKQQP